MQRGRVLHMTNPPAVLLTEAQLDVIATSFHGSPNMDIRALLGHIRALTAQRHAEEKFYARERTGVLLDLEAATRCVNELRARMASIRTTCKEEIAPRPTSDERRAMRQIARAAGWQSYQEEDKTSVRSRVLARRILAVIEGA